MALESAVVFAGAGDRRLESRSRCRASDALLARGELEAAEREARVAVIVAMAVAPAHASALGRLARVRLARGDGPTALELSKQAMELCERLGGLEEGEALVRLTYAEALAACGRAAEAAAAARAAHARLIRSAATIREHAVRAAYFEAVPEHARTVALVAQPGVA
jgi:hypothetical protein